MFLKTRGSKSPVDIGDLASTYVFVREIGRGGMGTVVVARHRVAGHFVAIKIASSETLDAEVLARLTREARLMARLQHPNIVKLYDVRPIGGGRIGIVMEYVRGQSLSEMLRTRRKLPFSTCTGILRDVGRALAHAHAGGVVHLDVKPANVLIEADSGAARLSDFGIAKGAGEVSEVTAAGGVMGTPAYMSPEQIDGGELDGRSDIYALGVLGWQLVSGEQPWAGEQLFKLLYKQKHEHLASLRALRRDAPEGVVLAIEGALEKDRARRWARVDDMVEQLDTPTPTAANIARQRVRAVPKPTPAAPSDGMAQQATVPIYRPRVLRNVSDSRNADTLQIAEAAATAAPSRPPSAAIAPAVDAAPPIAPEDTPSRWYMRREFAAGAVVGLSIAFLVVTQLSSPRDGAVVTQRSEVVVPGAVDSGLTASSSPAADSAPVIAAAPVSTPALPPTAVVSPARDESPAVRARALVFSNNATRAAPMVDSALRRDPRNGEAYILRARLRIAQGDVREAWTDIEMAARMGFPWEAVALSTMLNVQQSGTALAREQIEESLREALTPRRKLDADQAVGLAAALVSLGDTATALTLLEQAEPDERLPMLLADPLLTPLRSSRRFHRVLQDSAR